MTIQVGDNIPSSTLFYMTDTGVTKVTTDELFSGKKVVLFALPGAFTPTCSASHLPGYVMKSNDILAKGIDSIVCISVNDPYVMAAWGEQHNVASKVKMIADGNGDFTRAIGLEINRADSGMGLRSQRYAMLINNGIVELLNVEQAGKFEISDAETILHNL
ncbi:MAG: peroxiredoxin [Gammaproteobacteria bacterium]|jgi:peroxiredoxin|nr:peroxiredoxin [Gammaproteobacteria bacterium]MBT3723096.1 peroxiredoxin [Gammaproteobacteria bacterium]MBT4192735.1 peroxiredoxin [Gammaproteobacteria bacterium]MBT4448427.1 peroxiredoxin [Gammaproteobacteria bacterium]MBT4862020.1 peroxiredoxin [Gammaproteobacteria bacterium]